MNKRWVTDSGVVCPRPRRIGSGVAAVVVPLNIRASSPSLFLQINNHHQQQQQAESSCDAKARTELLDIIRTKKGSYACYERSNFQVASSPPYFSGSPPTRASNPVIQDEHFGNDEMGSNNSNPSSPSPTRSRNGSGGVRVKPAPVRRIEGFNCRGGNACSISALAA